MMEKPGPESKLHSFFHDVIRQSFRQLGIYDSTVTRYMADVLTDFAKSENLYRIRSRKGKRMESVVEILSEQPAAPVDETQLLKERSLRKYLGDYALFMSGIFRSYVEGRGFLHYYIEEGSRSYWTVSESIFPSIVPALFSSKSFRRSLNTIPAPWIILAKPISPRSPVRIPSPVSCVKSRAG